MKINIGEEIIRIEGTKEELETLQGLIGAAIEANGVEGKIHCFDVVKSMNPRSLLFEDGTLEVSIYCEED